MCMCERWLKPRPTAGQQNPAMNGGSRRSSFCSGRHPSVKPPFFFSVGFLNSGACCLVHHPLPQFISVYFSRSVMSNSLRPHELQHASLPCPSPTPGACSNSCQSSQRCHPTISSSVIPFSSCLQSFQASRSFPMSQLFASGGQSIGVSASSISPSSEYSGLIPLGWTDWISLQSKGLSKVISNTTVQKHQFFSAQLSL